jgi:rsbT co-antagonist protein RsbR
MQKLSRTLLAHTTSETERIVLGIDTHYRVLVESVRDYAITTLDPEGYVTTWNLGAELLTGYRADEAIGQHLSRFYPPEDVEHGKTMLGLQLAATVGRFEDENWRVRKDGTRFWAHVVLTALRDAAGTLLGFGGVTRDLTEHKRIAETVERQAQEILEVSTPVLHIWQGVVVAPLIGMLDDQRAAQLTGRLLHTIVETQAQVALVDITGVPMMDTQTAQHLIETTKAVRLLGAEVVLTGIGPALAQTLVHLGINLSHIITHSSLSGGLRVALEVLGLQVRSTNGGC